MKSYEDLLIVAKEIDRRVKIKKKRDYLYAELLKFHELEPIKNREFIIGIKDDPDSRAVGVELEVGFSPDIKLLPTMAKIFKKYPSINAGFGSSISRRSYSTEESSFAIESPSTMLYNCSTLIDKPPHPDGGGLESVLTPATLLAHQRLKSDYEFILKVYEFYGYTDQRQGAGIHLNIDLTLFGEDVYQGLVNFYNFLFFHNDFFMYLCGRWRSDGVNSSVRHQIHIGDWHSDLQQFRSTFTGGKSSLKTVLKDKVEWWFLNTSIHRDGRPCIEWRWFGSTLNIETFMAFVELGFALPIYCSLLKSENLVNLDNFINWVTKDATYPHLFTYILDIKEEFSKYQVNVSITGKGAVTTV